MSVPRSNPQTIFRRALTDSSSLTINVDTSVKPNVLASKHNDPAISTLMESVLSKLVRDPKIDEKKDTETGEFNIDVDRSLLQSTVDDTALSIKEAKNLLDALPDLTLVKDIIISSVLSPNDMMSTELTFFVESELYDDVENELIKVVKDYFEDDYKLKTKLSRWLEKSLFIEGATALGVIPESSIDHAINSNLRVTHESLGDQFKDGEMITYGMLSTPKYKKGFVSSNKRHGQDVVYSAENFSVSADTNYDPNVGVSNKNGFNLGIKVLDNPNFLKLPLLNNKIRRDKLTTAYGRNNFGIETFNKPWAKKSITGSADIYPNRMGESRPVITLKTLDQLEEETIGHPIVFEFPTESVIPVFSPTDPSVHVCYFVALDENGNPLKIDQHTDQYRSMESSFQSTVGNNVTSTLMTSAQKLGMGDINDRYNSSSVKHMSDLFSKVIEQDLIQRLDSGGFMGRDLKMGKAIELHQLMFVRALNQLNTQLLFLPADLMTYIAFDYKPNGVGRSLLDKTKVIGSLRMVDTMVSAIANAKSSIDHRKIHIQLDPEDPDPMKRVTQYLHEFQRATKASFPMGANSFTDITDYLQKAGVQVTMSGHEGMPDMNMEVSNQRYDYNKPDDNYGEELAKKQTMALGAPPETIRSAEDIQFATSIISSNIYFAKISLWRQEVYCEHLSDHIQKFTRNSQPLMSALTEVIKNNRENLTKIDKKFSDEAVALVFANNIRVQLPKPDIAQSQMQLDSMEKYEQLLEKGIPAYLSSDLANAAGLGEKVGDSIDAAAQVLKAGLLREWMIKNNVLPELSDLVNDTTDAQQRFEFLAKHSKYLDSFSPSIRKYIIDGIALGKKNDGIIEKAEELTGGEQQDDGVSGGFDGGSSGGSDSGGGDDYDSDDGDFDDDFGDEDGGGDEDGDDDLGDFDDF